jgi:putative toxin-antitoxin system antitoxin component (TIGR02293 family)
MSSLSKAKNPISSEARGANVEERLLGKLFGKQPSEFQLAELAERGLPVKSVDFLRNEGLTFSEVHGVVLPARTLKHRREKKQPLSVEETDRTLRVAKIISLADQVFGNHEKGLRWLRRENQRLEGRTPLEMLRSEVGGELVRQMLYQIDEGIYV